MTRIVPTLHPSFIQRGAWHKLYFLVEDLKKAQGQAWLPTWEPAAVEYAPWPTLEEARAVLKVGDPRPLILDIETRGIEDDAEIACCGVAREPRRVVCLPWRRPFMDLLRTALLDGRSTKVAHNAGFDFPRLERALRIERIAGPWFDTLEAWNLVQPDLEKGLDVLGSLVFDGHPWKGDKEDTLEVYNCKDVDVTARAMVWLTGEMKAMGVEGLFKDRVMPALKVIINMRERGMRVDLDAQAAARRDLEPRLERAKAELGEIVGMVDTRKGKIAEAVKRAEELEQSARSMANAAGKREGQYTREGRPLLTAARRERRLAEGLATLNVASPRQLAQFLYEDLGFPLKTKKSKAKGGEESVSTDDDALLELERTTHHPALGLIREIRELDKFLGTYLSFEEEILHPRLLMWGTATGRLSCRDPNFQNIPKRKPEFAKIVRGMIQPSVKGWMFTAADYSQIERRLQAVLWGDRSLQEAFDGGRDVHRWTASLMWGIDYDKVTNTQRTLAKTVVYGTSYGMGYLKLHRDLTAMGIEISVGGTKDLLERLKAAHPGVALGQAQTLAAAERDHMLRNPFGRVRWFYGPTHGAALNFPFQSTTADVVLGAMVKLEEELPPPAQLVMQVHDELLVMHPAEIKDEVQETMRRVMEAPIEELNGWSCPVDVKSGWNWWMKEV